MGKHDVRTAQTQAIELINIILNDPLLVSSLLRYKSDHEFTNPRDIPDLLKVQSLISASTSTIPDWQPDTPIDENGLVLHVIGGIKYMFQSLLDNNASEPTLSNNTWTVISGGIQIASAGPNAPATSQGNNGDLYFIVPNDSTFLELRQKINGVWVAVFTLPIPPARVENIQFTAATGTYTINFLMNNRQALFPNPYVEVWGVSGNTETLTPGVSIVKNKTSGQITSISLDAVFGDGYINLINR